MGHDLPEFEVLSALYKSNPQAFEEFRRNALREAIDQAPPRHRPALNALLEKMEHARKTAASPIDAAIIASRMMNESAERLFTAWADAQYAVAGLQTTLLIQRLRKGQRTQGPAQK